MGTVTPFKKDSDKKIDFTSYKKKLFQHKMKLIIGAASLCAVLIAVIVVVLIKFSNKVYTDYEVIDRVKFSKIDGSSVFSYNDQFITYSKDGIHCTNSKGKDTWSVPFEMQNPMVDICGEYVAAADRNGRTAYVFNYTGELGRIETNLPIKKLAVSGTGVIAIITEDEDNTPINLYKYDGTKIATFRTTMSKSGYPMAIDISENGKLFIVSYLYLDNGELTSKVAFYNFGDVGQNESDNLVSGYDYADVVVPSVGFLNEKYSYACASNKLVFFDGKERPTNLATVELTEEVQAIYSGDEHIGLLYLDSTGEAKYRLDIYNEKGQKESSVKFNKEYSDIFFANNQVIIYNATSAAIYKDNGRLKYDSSFKESVALMIPTSSKTKYILVTSDSIQTIVLK